MFTHKQWTSIFAI